MDVQCAASLHGIAQTWLPAADGKGGAVTAAALLNGPAEAGDAVRALYSSRRPCILCSTGRDLNPALSISCCIRRARTSCPRDVATPCVSTLRQ